MINLRFKWVVISNLFFVLYAVPKANYMIGHPEKYDERERYRFACRIIDNLRRHGRTRTRVYGRENLPDESGYILYSNHQGKYDALGILLGLGVPCGVLWEEKQAKKFLARQVCLLLEGVTIDLEDPRDKVKAILKVTEQVKKGKTFLIFPEGGYKDNKNELQEFHSGCFSCSLKSGSPIVPVAIYDSYKSMNSNTFERVTTQVHFLEPIPYEEYGSMKKAQIGEMVKQKIADKIKAIENGETKECPFSMTTET